MISYDWFTIGKRGHSSFSSEDIAVPRKQWSDAGRLLLALAGTMAFFAGAMVLAQPRYLPLLEGALHPQWRL